LTKMVNRVTPWRMTQIILSLCDFSGAWSAPYLELTADGEPYVVVRVDPKHGEVNQQGRGMTSGSVVTGMIRKMDDGGVGLGMTAGALAVLMESGGVPMLAALLGLDPATTTVAGVLAAPPCTDFSVSGARWWADKDADGRTAASVEIVEDCLRVVDAAKPRFWVLENPVGRIAKLVPRIGQALMTFHPSDFAGLAPDPDKEAYTKRTCLWGQFNPDLATAARRLLPEGEIARAPVMIEKVNAKGKVLRGSWMWANLGGKSERTKELRSMTPIGFSRAFAAANP
jgi:hypothetical protein